MLVFGGVLMVRIPPLDAAPPSIEPSTFPPSSQPSGPGLTRALMRVPTSKRRADAMQALKPSFSEAENPNERRI